MLSANDIIGGQFELSSLGTRALHFSTVVLTGFFDCTFYSRFDRGFLLHFRPWF